MFSYENYIPPNYFTPFSYGNDAPPYYNTPFAFANHTPKIILTHFQPVMGSVRSIGREMPQGLASRTFAVMIKNEKVVADVLHYHGGNAIAIQPDLSKVAEVRRLIDESEKLLS